MAARILVVEDDAHMLQGICDALAMAGYESLPASTGEEALACLEQAHVDLILSDIMMPAMDGYALFGKVRSNPAWTSIPFIFLTAKGQKMDIRLGKQLGADDYVTKPFEVEDLLIAIQSKLERATALRQASQAELARVKQNILNTLSHEFRTPLTYISGYVELLEHDDVSLEDVKAFLGHIRKGSERLKRLVEDFLLVVALETGEIESIYRMQLVAHSDLAARINYLLDTLEARAAARSVRLRRELPDLPPVTCHVDYVLDAIGRLVDNAIKFSKREGGTVSVCAWASQAALYIAVSDEGIGIRPEQRELLFRRFSQIDRHRLEQQGAGVGLYIAYGIVKMHAGRIEVESELGVGSTFTIELPLLPA